MQWWTIYVFTNKWLCLLFTCLLACTVQVLILRLNVVVELIQCKAVIYGVVYIYMWYLHRNSDAVQDAAKLSFLLMTLHTN